MKRKEKCNITSKLKKKKNLRFLKRKRETFGKPEEGIALTTRARTRTHARTHACTRPRPPAHARSRSSARSTASMPDRLTHQCSSVSPTSAQVRAPLRCRPLPSSPSGFQVPGAARFSPKPKVAFPASLPSGFSALAGRLQYLYKASSDFSLRASPFLDGGWRASAGAVARQTSFGTLTEPFIQSQLLPHSTHFQEPFLPLPPPPSQCPSFQFPGPLHLSHSLVTLY